MLGYPECIEDMKGKFEKLLLTDDEVNNQILLRWVEILHETAKIKAWNLFYLALVKINLKMSFPEYSALRSNTVDFLSGSL